MKCMGLRDDSTNVRPSVRPSIKIVQKAGTEWWTEWMEGSFSISIRPSDSDKDGRKMSVFCRKMDGREYQFFFICPSVHFVMDGMDERTLVEVGFVRPSVKTGQIPSFLDDFYGWTD